MDNSLLKETLESFLLEDVGVGDVTTQHTPEKKILAVVKTRGKGVIAGLKECVLLARSHDIEASSLFSDGGNISSGDVVLTLSGSCRVLLTLERTLLNVLARMSGIATLTREYVDAAAAANPEVKIAATRKTTPNFRYFEKRAVVLGGGRPHRMGLYDQVLIKDNHILVFGGVSAAVKTLKEKSDPKLKIEVEVFNLPDAVAAIEAGADIIMLDNMTPEKAGETIRELEEKGLTQGVVIELSGGINLDNIGDYAKTGADVLSTSKLITAAPSLDFSLTVV